MTRPLSHRAKRRAAYREMRRNAGAKLVSVTFTDGTIVSRRCRERIKDGWLHYTTIGPATITQPVS